MFFYSSTAFFPPSAMRRCQTEKCNPKPAMPCEENIVVRCVFLVSGHSICGQLRSVSTVTFNYFHEIVELPSMELRSN